MEMDFHSMKRKRLQALCKKHGIPANLKNKEMADRLSFIYKGKEIEDSVCSGNAGSGIRKKSCNCVGGKEVLNVEMIDLVTPSPGLEKRSEFSANHLKVSEIEGNLFPETTTGGFEICGVEEDMKNELNKNQVVSCQGSLDSAPSVVGLEEFNNHLVEGEVKKLGDKNNLSEDVRENGKGRDEAVEKGDHNSSQGSNLKGVNVLRVSEVEFYPMTEEDEVVEEGDHNSPQGSNLKVVNVSEVESGYPVMEEDEAVEQDDHNSPQGPNTEDMDVLLVFQEESSYPLMEEDEVVAQDHHNCPQGSNLICENVLHVSQEECGFPLPKEDEAAEQGGHNSPQGSNFKGENVLHVSKLESGYPMMEKNEAVEQFDRISHQGSNLKSENVLHVSQEESDYPLLEEDEAAEQGDHNIPQGSNSKDVHVSEQESVYPVMDKDEVVEQGEHNSPQGPNTKDMNVLHVSKEEHGYHMMEEDEAIKHGDQNGPQVSNMKDTDGKTNLTAKYFADVFPSSSNKYSVGSPNQFQRTYPENEVKSSGLNIHQDDLPSSLNKYLVGTPNNEDLVPSVEVRNHLLEEEVDKLSLIADSEEVDVGVYDVEDNKKIDVIKEQVDDSQQVIRVPFIAMFSNNEDLVHVSSVEVGNYLLEGQVEKAGLFAASNGVDIRVYDVEDNIKIDVNKELNDDTQQVIHTPSSVKYLNRENLVQFSSVEVGHHLLEGEVENSGVITYLKEGTRSCDIKENAQTEASKEKVDDRQHVIDAASSVMVLNNEDLVQVASVEIGEHLLEGEVEKSCLLADSDEVIGICDVKEIVQIDVSKEQADDSQQVIDAASSVMALNNEDLVQAASVEVGDHLLEGEVEKSGLIADSEEFDIGVYDVEDNMKIDVIKEQDDESKQVIHEASSVKDLSKEDVVQFSFVEIGDHLLEGEVEKFGLIAHSEGVDTGVCDAKENVQIEVSKEQIDDSQQVIDAASTVLVLNNEDPVQVASVEVGDNLLEGEVEKSGLVADNLEPLASKGFQTETYFDPCILRDVATCDIEESRKSELILLHRSMEASNSVQEVIRLFDNSKVHDTADGIGAEDKGQHFIGRDMDSIEKYVLYDFHSIDDASGQNVDEKAYEYTPNMPQLGEMKSCTFKFQQTSPSGTVFGDKGTFKVQLETPPKCAIAKPLESPVRKEMKIVSSLPTKRAIDVLGASDIKENIKVAKKEQVGTIISRSAFPKRKPLQDLQQN